MTSIGVSFEGFPNFPLKKLDNGYLIPDVSVAELNERHRVWLRNQIEAASRAETLGYEYVVHSEHHSNLLSTVSPNPILTHTAIARETEEVRLLQMANILPWHEPVRIAEQVAMLDVLSNGRVDVGVGRGGTDPASETLGQYWGGTPVNQTKNHLSFEEKYEILIEAWTDDLVTHEGQFHQIPPKHTEWEKRQEYFYFADSVCEYDPDDYMSVIGDTTTLNSLPVLPQPEQKPHPQIWKPALSVHSAEWAARRGVNICTHIFDISHTNELIDAYYAAAESAEWPDRRSEYEGTPFRRGWDERCNRGIGIIIPVFNTEVADEDTHRRWKAGLEYVRTRKENPDDIAEGGGVDIDIDQFIAESDVPVVGDSAEICDRIISFIETCDLEDAFVIVDPNGIGLTHEERLSQLQSFAEDVRPVLEDRYPRS